MSVKILNLSICFLCFTLGLLVNTSVLSINDLLTCKQEMLNKNTIHFASSKSAIIYYPCKYTFRKPSKVVMPKSDFELKFGVNQAWSSGKGTIIDASQSSFTGNQLILVEKKPRSLNLSKFKSDK